MANIQKICVFDLETDGANPLICSPVQIAAVMVDPKKLEIIPDSEFNISLKPEKLEIDSEYDYSDSDVLDFHAKVRGCTSKEILESWKGFQKQEQGWKMFISYLDLYHIRKNKKSMFTAPIAAGYNINRFDLKITDRLSAQYGNIDKKENKSNIFYPRDMLDLMHMIFYWFEGNSELKNYTLDHLREYFGIDKTGAHDALKDVKDTAEIMIRFLRLHRNLSAKIKFRDSFAD
jgi:DNA polymerase III epsilon subunit-like protein